MRTTQRRIDPGVIDQAIEAPERFEFFQLVRLFEILLRRDSGVGGDQIAERIRFRNSLRLGFAPSQVDAMQHHREVDAEGRDTEKTARVEITPSFMGMLGINGALPTHYTEQVISQERSRRDLSTRAFLDLFTNRSVGHFYKAWKKYRLPIQYESDRKNRFLPQVLSLAGIGFESLRDRLHDSPGRVDDESIGYFAGLLQQRPVSAEVLKRVIGGYFRESVRIEQFVGRWYVMPREQRSTLGGINARLGETSMLGERVWQRNLRIRIFIGPLGHAKYMALLPKGEFAAALGKILALATGCQFEYEIRPILRGADVRPIVLDTANGGRLGFDSFMITKPQTVDRSDTAYAIHPLQ